MDPAPIAPIDPFDLPEWLGVADVCWTATAGLLAGHLVQGDLVADDRSHPCDLLAVDEAYPAPVVPTEWRARAHQSWRHGEVLPVAYAGRLALAVPGTRFDADLALDAFTRLARAVGARPADWSVRLRLGAGGASGR